MAQEPLVQGWRTFSRAYDQIVYEFPRTFAYAHGKFEEQIKVLEPSIISTNYCIIISNTCYNWNYVIS